MTTPIRIAIAIALIFFFGFGVGLCSLKKKLDKPDPVQPTPAASEQQRQELETENRIAQARYAADSVFEQRILKAIDERLAKQSIQDKAATEKAVNSALQYLKNPTLENCHHALEDCQHENQAKAAVIGTQSEKISSLKRTVKADSTEINRYRMANHLLNENFRDANQRWQADLDKASKGRYSLYGVIQAGTDGKALKSVTPAAVLTTPKGWLLMGGYDVMQGQYTAGGGIEIRFGR